MLAVTALVDAGGTVTAVTDSGRNDRTCHAIAADMHVSMILGADAVNLYRTGSSGPGRLALLLADDRTFASGALCVGAAPWPAALPGPCVIPPTMGVPLCRARGSHVTDVISLRGAAQRVRRIAHRLIHKLRTSKENSCPSPRPC